MSRDVVIVTCWRRPALLHRTLELLTAAEHAAEHLYLLCVDRGFDPAVMELCAQFPLDKRIHYQHHSYAGNSYNTLAGYRLGCEAIAHTGGRLVYLVEEDIHVAEDFFDFHRQVYDLDIDAAVAALDQTGVRPGTQPPIPGEKEEVHVHAKFQSWGVSLRASRLGSILEHAYPAYFEDMIGYVARAFPSSQIALDFAEQDGLIDRVAERDGWRIAYPCVARAYHAGTIGYHAGIQHAIRPCDLAHKHVQEFRLRDAR